MMSSDTANVISYVFFSFRHVEIGHFSHIQFYKNFQTQSLLFGFCSPDSNQCQARENVLEPSHAWCGITSDWPRRTQFSSNRLEDVKWVFTRLLSKTAHVKVVSYWSIMKFFDIFLCCLLLGCPSSMSDWEFPGEFCRRCSSCVCLWEA